MKAPEQAYRYQMWVGGRPVEAVSGRRFVRESPAHGVPVGEYPFAEREDVDLAVAAARKAFEEGPWPKLSGAERAKLLLKGAEQIRTHAEELALIETLESGKPIAQARFEMEWAAGLWDYAATLARHVYGDTYNALGAEAVGLVFREPIGVVGMITPWNFPLLIISQKLPFALAVGCTAVVKPSELTPGTTLRLAELLAAAGIPPGVVNVISGEGIPAGAHLAGHPEVDMISFTGSTEVGRAILQSAGTNLKRVGLELGGKNPHIIFADADLDAALEAAVFGVYFNAGQCCNSGSRLLVQSTVAERVLEAIISRSKSVPVGDPLDERTKVGPLVSEEQLAKVEMYVSLGIQQGARLCTGGSRLPMRPGRYFAPTVFENVSPEMRIAKEEIFGPVLAVIQFRDAEEAARIANNTMYGLSAGVWTRDVDTALSMCRSIRAGTIWVNSFMDGAPELCFGGYKQSGLGRELGRFSIGEFTELKTVYLKLGAKGSSWLRD